MDLIIPAKGVVLVVSLSTADLCARAQSCIESGHANLREFFRLQEEFRKRQELWHAPKWVSPGFPRTLHTTPQSPDMLFMRQMIALEARKPSPVLRKNLRAVLRINC